MRGKTWRAHRLLFAWTHPEIDITGYELDHVVCDTPGCVRPDHLRPSTTRENVLRGRSGSAENARKTHCIHGHEFSLENTQIDRNGKRVCRACGRRKKREELQRRGDVIRARKRSSYKIKTWPERRCRTCGETFVPKTYNNWYCSLEHQEQRRSTA